MRVLNSAGPLCRLDEVATIERDAVAPDAIRSGTNYVGLEHIDSDGSFVGMKGVIAGELASNKLRFGPKHILFGKLRPYLRKTALPDFEGICSTDIVPILPGPRVDRSYLFHFLRHPKTVEQAVLRCAGANLPRLSPRDLSAFEVPVPPLQEQRRVADILDKADTIRRKRKEAIALTEELLRSAFLDMFGDPMVNPKKWAMRPLGELLLMPLRNGLSPASGGGYPARVLTLSAITRGRFDGKAVKDGFFAVDPWGDVRLDARDFLICRGNGNLGMVGSGAFPSASDASVVFPDTMIAARVDEGVITPSYLTSVWTSALVRRQLEAGARTTNGTYKINQSCIEAIRLPVPGREVQIAFANVAQRVAHALEVQGKTSCEAAALFESLTDRAFNGALRS